MIEEIEGMEVVLLTDKLAEEKGSKATKLMNPETNGLSFGYIPKNKTIEAGEIYLTLGYSGYGVKRAGAFGARHVWEKHKVDLCLVNFSDVPAKVAALLANDCDVMVNPLSGGLESPIVLNTSHGMVALAKKMIDKKPEYHVISAYGRRNPHGFVVAKLKKPK